MRVLATLATLACAAAAATDHPDSGATDSDLQTQFQAVVDKYVLIAKQNHFDLGMQLGWKSATDSFAVAAGKTGTSASRDVTAADTFMYGSGTKPVTAAAVMRLADSKEVSWHDKASKYINPFLQRTNGTTMETLFGSAVANATVLQLIRMSAGIPDFEVSDVNPKGGDPCDTEVLTHPYDVWPPYYFIRFAANKTELGPGGHLVCQPGECSAYSSTSYEVAGLLLVALQYPDGDWTDLDMRVAAMPRPEDSYPSLRFFNGKVGERLNETLTVAGKSTSPSWPHVTVFDQNPSILGWACGNMVGSTRDVAAWYYDLLEPESTNHIVSDTARAEMLRMETFTAGWSNGTMVYGAGLMAMGTSLTRRMNPDEWGYYVGHEGETFGFYSTNGHIPLAKAAFSLSINTDDSKVFYLGYVVVCEMVQILARRAGNSTYLGCPKMQTQWEAQHAQSLQVLV